MRVDAFPAGAHAGAAAELVAQAMTAALRVEAQRLQAERVLIRQRAQRGARGAARAEHAVEEGQRLRADLGRRGEAQPLAVEHEAAERLGAAQLPVVQRRELLYQARFGEERTELADRALPVDAAHRLQPARTGIEVLQHARAHRAALADVERRAAFAVEEINAGRLRDGIDRGALELRRQHRLLRHLARSDRQHFIAMLLCRVLQELPDRLRVRQRAMARFTGDAVPLDQAVEIVAALARIKPSRKLHAAERTRMELDAGAIELAAQERVVEARVMRDEDAAGEPLVQLRREVGEARRLREHLVRDAGKRLDLGRQRDARVY